MKKKHSKVAQTNDLDERTDPIVLELTKVGDETSLFELSMKDREGRLGGLDDLPFLDDMVGCYVPGRQWKTRLPNSLLDKYRKLPIYKTKRDAGSSAMFDLRVN